MEDVALLVVDASQELTEAVRLLISRDMATALVEEAISLIVDEAKSNAILYLRGFGAASIKALGSEARSIAVGKLADRIGEF